MDATELFNGMRLVPVVTLTHRDQAVPLAEVLVKAGIRAIEITLRTEAAIAAIKAVAAEVPGLLVGAGSIRHADQFRTVQDAGARFCVSPGSTPSLLEAAHDANMPFVPGAVTATEVLQLQERGYSLVKFFPAEVNGGVAAIRALSAPIPEVRFFPTGGITAGNIGDYLALKSVACVGGSWFVPGDCLQAGDFEKIESLARDAVRKTLG